MNITPNDTTIVCPLNDGEAATIIDLTRCLGFDVRVSQQPWGARLEREPDSTFRKLKQHVVLVEIPGPDREEELNKSHWVIIIDHHAYGDLDRSHPKSALEQFAALIGYTLNRWEMGVALNDRGYIPALLDAGYSEKEIEAIRRYDLFAQGYTDGDFIQLQEEYERGFMHGGFYVVTTSLAKNSYLADLHFRAKRHEDLVIMYTPSGGKVSKVSFSGRPEGAQTLLRTLGGYSGGDPAVSMYWGKEFAKPPEIDALLSLIDTTLRSVPQSQRKEGL